MNLKNIKKDIIIGTAQLYSKYGISNTTREQNINKGITFLSFAIKNGFTNIDTAYAYENAHKIIGHLILKEKHNPIIYSKIPKLKSYSKEVITEIFNKTINDLHVNKLKGLLLHNSRDWKNKTLKIFINNLLNKNIISSFGLSIYETQEISNDTEISILQVPGNIFNQEVILSEELNNFIQKQGEVHIRSIFVQGLILMNTIDIPQELDDCKKPIEIFQNIAKEINIPPEILAIACIKKLIPSSKIVLGFDRIQQLDNIKNIDKFCINDNDLNEIINFGKKHKSFIWEPRHWKL